jgi:hypothetical protein
MMAGRAEIEDRPAIAGSIHRPGNRCGAPKV